MTIRMVASFAVVALSIAACGKPPELEKDPNDQRVEVPAAPAATEGLQFVMPEATVPPGSEKMICWVPEFVPAEDYLLTRFEGLQGPSGHHVVAFISGTPRQPGAVFDCTEIETMASLKPLILPDPADKSLIPEGFAVRLPKDAKIVFQSHYVNASKSEIQVRDVAKMTLAKAGSAPTVLSYLILNQGNVTIPPMAPHTATVNCTIPQQMKVLVLLGHMHEKGKKILVERDHAGTKSTLYQEDAWTVEYRDRPPLKTYPPADPLLLEKDDVVSLRCDWSNDSNEELRFPSEMCTTVGYYYPADSLGIHICE